MTRAQLQAMFSAARKIYLYSTSKYSQKLAQSIAVDIERYIGQQGRVPADVWHTVSKAKVRTS